MSEYSISINKIILDIVNKKLNSDKAIDLDIIDTVSIDKDKIKNGYLRNNVNKFIDICHITHLSSVVKCFVKLGWEWDSVTCGIYVRYTPKNINACRSYYNNNLVISADDMCKPDVIFDCKKDIDTISIYISDPFRAESDMIHITNIPFDPNNNNHKFIKEKTK